jgi:hypothetical protein
MMMFNVLILTEKRQLKSGENVIQLLNKEYDLK